MKKAAKFLIIITLLLIPVLLLIPSAKPTALPPPEGVPENFREFAVDFVFLHRGILVKAAQDGVVYAVRYSTQLVTSANHGDDWTFVHQFAHQIQGIYLDDAGNIFVSTSYDRWSPVGTGEIFKSSDGGATFRRVLVLEAGAALNWSFASRDGLMFISEYGYKGDNNARKIFRSRDFGETWEIVFDPPPRREWHNHKILITDDGIVYQSVGDGANAQILRSADNGDSWQVASRGFHPTSALVCDTYILWGLDSGRVPGVLRQNLQTGERSQSFALPRRFNGAAYDMATAHGVIYTGFMSYYGQNFPGSLFYSTDNGLTWNLLGYVEKPSPDYGIGFYHIVVDERFGYIDFQAPVVQNGQTVYFRGTVRFDLLNMPLRRIIFNGEYIGSTPNDLLPLRAVIEFAGGKIVWDDYLQQAVVILHEKNAVANEYNSVLVNHRMMVAPEFFVDYFGMSADYRDFTFFLSFE
ncbi:MAG: hypothetical protein FWC70_08460 [Defluviitaleaceae bacterium]|nr:hypothetical protein [Defluviitaleaceae bacterium]